jgi:enoyl-CoA hydratase
MPYENIELKKDGALAWLTVKRPKALNALNFQTLDEMDAALDEVAADSDIGLLVITGDGEKAFVAGADIAELHKLDHDSGMEAARRGQKLFDRIDNLPIPVIAAVNGFALGGGCELALACDIRVAADNAVLGLPEVKLGVIPGYGGTQRLPRLVGPGFALEMILSGRMVKAEEALAVGLVNGVVAAEALEITIREMARMILANGPLALQAAKEAIKEGLQHPLGEGLEIEARLFGGLCGSSDQKEGMSAFLEKRKAEFEGK